MAAATLTDASLSVDVTGANGGTLSCDGAPHRSTAPITGTLPAGADLSPPVTLVCHYSDMADGAVIAATLNVKYTINGLERIASGSRAAISFTIQSD